MRADRAAPYVMGAWLATLCVPLWLLATLQLPPRDWTLDELVPPESWAGFYGLREAFRQNIGTGRPIALICNNNTGDWQVISEGYIYYSPRVESFSVKMFNQVGEFHWSDSMGEVDPKCQPGH